MSIDLYGICKSCLLPQYLVFNVDLQTSDCGTDSPASTPFLEHGLITGGRHSSQPKRTIATPENSQRSPSIYWLNIV